MQRAGTWLLAHLLRSTGVAGKPGEFFSASDMPRLREEWGVRDDAAYLERVLDAGTTPNGVFSAKLMRNEFETFMYVLRRLLREYDASDLDVIARLFPDPRFVWIRRRDAVAQAVSWAKAAQTGQYAAHQEQTRGPQFDFEQIDNLLHLVRVQNGAWRRWFAQHDVAPVEVVYEDLVADHVGVTLRVLAAMRLEPDPGAAIAPPAELTKQADEVNDEWVARYRDTVSGRC